MDLKMDQDGGVDLTNAFVTQFTFISAFEISCSVSQHFNYAVEKEKRSLWMPSQKKKKMILEGFRGWAGA